MRTKRRNRALSLVEVAVAIGVLGVGLFVVAEIFQSARVGAERAALQVKAAGLASLKLEELRTAGSALKTELEKSTTVPLHYPTTGWKQLDEDSRFQWLAEITKNDKYPQVASIRVLVAKAGEQEPQPISEVSGFALLEQGGAR